MMIANKLLVDREVNEVMGVLSQYLNKSADEAAKGSLEAGDKTTTSEAMVEMVSKHTGLLSEAYLDSVSEDEYTSYELKTRRELVMEKYRSYVDDI